MRLLLDTHALLWWWLADPALPPRAAAAIEDGDNVVFVSAATAWEIATKVRKGQLAAMRDRIDRFEEDVVADGFQTLPVAMIHGLKGGALHGAHKDPFDRILAAQALLENMVLVTCDREMAAFGCETLW
ncbi:type II toxin-antitoxin system VapC family toxin [Sphingomonas sp. S6]|jgi:PIN domain nuclease of toxin-antitoxin system|uniref:type II toxin-antitoxin system VapC family toxin n=1 Tax=Sphingomonas sp. S6 TaxID=3368600 RepID=UPI000FA85051|nr:type II toxin-antitoxin system VapC family toxin [uncultured Sphingomonas sp.]RTL16206.1 MAG: type II toxin-antitoxin system VapC family toxin [Sphingomonadaceae bacterium]